MNVFGPLFIWHIGPLAINADIVIQWFVMLFLIVLLGGLATTFKVENPGKIQCILEMIYEYISDLVDSNMGLDFHGYVPFVGTLFLFLFMLDCLGLIGFGPPTRNLSVVIGFTVIAILIIHGTAIKRKGVGRYFKGFIHPYAAMLPLNIMEAIVFPLSLCLRLWGNMLAAAIVMSLVYKWLYSIAWVAQIGFPIMPHSFFDLFDGALQTVIFVMLVVINIKLEVEH
ncbi:F0F1 ATP synthase subunit A [Clostridium sp.]|uniref:F0F1 ATP synthase subunit A n=1 Tax=Clostridium sp. TaxID=1506 RepID=UPI003994620C